MELEIQPPAWAVQLLSDLTDMDRNPQRLDVRRGSSLTLTLPDDVYFEYAFRDAEGNVRADPRNPLRAENPWYPEVSAVLGLAYRPDPYADPGPAQATGTLGRHRLSSRELGQVRRVSVYTPAGIQRESLPVVYLQDGVAYLRIARIQLVLEALIREGLARPAHLVFIEPVDRDAEYGFDPRYRTFIIEELLPFIESCYPVNGERLLMGASLGGLVSACLALERPELFAAVLTQSGAFLGTPDDRDFYHSGDSWLLSQLRERPSLPQLWYTEVGTLEWLLGVNRKVHELLVAKSYRHRYSERSAGHNWVNWRNGLSGALRFGLAP